MMMCLSPIPKLEAYQTRRRLGLRVIDHVHERQKSTAVLKSLDLGAVLAIVPITQKTAESIDDIRGHHDYAASGARQGPGSWG